MPHEVVRIPRPDQHGNDHRNPVTRHPDQVSKSPGQSNKDFVEAQRRDREAVQIAEKLLKQENLKLQTAVILFDVVRATPEGEQRKAIHNIFTTVMDRLGLCSACEMRREVEKWYDDKRLGEIIIEAEKAMPQEIFTDSLEHGDPGRFKPLPHFVPDEAYEEAVKRGEGEQYVRDRRIGTAVHRILMALHREGLIDYGPR